MPLHPQAQAVADFYAAVRTTPFEELSPDDARAVYNAGQIPSEEVVFEIRDIDAGGIPLSTLVYKQEFSILITDSFLPDAQAIATQIGTRNASTFLNYPSGSVVFAGCNCETIPEVGRNSIEYRFIYDQAYHQIQYPVKGNNGSPILAAATAGTILKGSAEKVFYKQPFKYTSNFNNLSQYFTGL